MGTNNGRIYGKRAQLKGAPQRFWGAVAPNCHPLDPPLFPVDFLLLCPTQVRVFALWNNIMTE